MAKKLTAITLLAVALSFVRPYDAPSTGGHPVRHDTPLAAAPLPDLLAARPPLALREREPSFVAPVYQPSRDRIVGSLQRQVT